MSMSYDEAKAFFSEAIFRALVPYKERIEPALVLTMKTFGEKNNLRDACEYALQSGGKRFRPALVLMIADALNEKNYEKVDVTYAAMAVEFFHTASLIADDLPCMDNDDFRRGRPTTHKVYGESVALLASFSLIAAGFEYLAMNSEKQKEICQIAILHASRLNGSPGLIGGQYLDLFPPHLDREKLYEIIDRKTVCLFELSFLLGWIFAQGDLKMLSEVKNASFHFGAAFQILDDLDDMEKDAQANRKANFANLFGKSEAVNAIQEHIEKFKKLLKVLEITSDPLNNLAEGMSILTKAF